MITDIYIKILNEEINVWRPVKAEQIEKNIFKIIDKTDFKKNDEILEFNYGDIVICYKKNNEYFANGYYDRL